MDVGCDVHRSWESWVFSWMVSSGEYEVKIKTFFEAGSGLHLWLLQVGRARVVTRNSLVFAACVIAWMYVKRVFVGEV